MQEFDISLPMESLFEQPTVVELAELVSRLVSEKASASDEPLIDRQVTDPNATIPRRSSSDTSPLSFAQQRLWFLDQMEPGNPAYNMHAKLRVGGLLSVAILGRSLTEILRRHEALRTTYHATGTLPVQRISPAKAFRLPVIDLSDLPPHEQELEVQRLDTEEARQPFHLARGPLFRAVLLRLGADDHVLLLTMHHVVSDGWSMGVLYRELGTLYTSLSKDEAVPLPELPIQYADYALWQRQWLEGERLKNGLEYWRKQLSERPPSLALPVDRPRPSEQTYQGARVHRTISAPLMESLRRVSRQEESTPFMLLLAAFQTLLLRYSGQEDILVGTPIANRTRVETEKLIGFFANTLVMRTDLSGDPTFRAALQRVRATALEAFSHQDVPFEKLVEDLGPERSANQVPLFQVMFAFQNVSARPPELGRDLSVRLLDVDSEVAKFDLTLYLSESAQGLKGTWQYNSDLFESATIERMATHFEMLLDGIAANPSQRLSELPVLTDAERRQLLIDWNPVTATTPSDRCVRQLFEEQVRRTPDAPAVQCGDVRLTYAELNHRADQLAHRLHRMGTNRTPLWESA